MGYLAFILPGLLVGWGIFELFDHNSSDDNDETLNGTEQADDLDGQNGDDLINGAGGDDNIQGGSGADRLRGDDGDDVIFGQQGNDDIEGGAGDDVLVGERGADTIRGGDGSDWVEGNQGDDALEGNAGDDLLLGGSGEDTLSGGDDDDALFGGKVRGLPLSFEQMQMLRDGATVEDFEDVLPPSTFQLRDDGEVDVLNGDGGDDLLVLGAGDVGDGGEGIDSFMILQNQLGDAGPAIVQDFEDDEAIGVVTNSAADPEITVQDDGDDALVLADEVIVARVLGAAGRIDAGDIFIYNTSAVDVLGI